MADIVILGAQRTPIGGFQGSLSNLTATDLGAAAIRGAMSDAKVTPDQIDDVIMGIVLSAGVGQAPARQASLGAGLGIRVPTSAVSKVCGSGLQAVFNATLLLETAQAGVVVAGGMESMSNAPYLAPMMRGGARLGHASFKDHMFLDGLEDAYEQEALMGTFAETCAEKYRFGREAEDVFAVMSLDRAGEAERTGAFDP